MLAVLAVNATVAMVQRRWARRLGSDILLADATHTAGDVLTTVVVLVGWQLSAAGHAWLDSALAVLVALLVLRLAWGLFKRAVPVLVDGTAVEPEALEDTVAAVRGVRGVSRVRSRWTGSSRAVDVVVTVSPELTIVEGHAIADAVEAILRERFAAEDVTVHVEPATQSDTGEAAVPERR
jgi:cation diffusion facilitator family transporter